MARRQRKSLRQRREPLPRPAPAGTKKTARRPERRTAGTGIHRQRQRRGHRPGVPHLLRTGPGQRRVDSPHLRHVPCGGANQQRRNARGTAGAGFLASGGSAAGSGGRPHQTAVALLAQQPYGQCLSRAGNRATAPPLRGHGRARRSLHRLRGGQGIPAATRRVPEPHRPPDPLQSMGHGRTAARTGIRLGRGRGPVRPGQIPLQHQYAHAAGRCGNFTPEYLGGDRRNTLRTRTPRAGTRGRSLHRAHL